MSTLKANNIQEATSGGATYYLNKAWVNFDGTGTVSIRDDGNISSITDQGTAKYQSTFSNNMSDINYSMSTWAGTNASSNYYRMVQNQASTTFQTSNVRIQTPHATTGSMLDAQIVCLNFIR